MNLKTNLVVFDIVPISNIHYSLDYIPHLAIDCLPHRFLWKFTSGAKKTD
jgi:hypothetical protein